MVEDEQAVYTDPDGKVWHPHRGYWCWKVSSELAQAQERIKELEAQLAEMTILIKPLEWKELSTGWIAHTSFHAYEVVKTDHGFMATYANRDFAWGTEDAMKVAAQADFDHRILSALEATPPAPKVTYEMVEAALKSLHENPVSWESRSAIRAALTAAQEAGKP